MIKNKRHHFFWFLAIAFILASCTSGNQPTEKETTEKPAIVKKSQRIKVSNYGNEKLSEYGFFTGKLSDLIPAKGVIPYELNTPLFSDYAFKKRFIRLPKEGNMVFNAKDPFDFPTGSILIKNFYYPTDFRKPQADRRIIETRLLILEKKGWKALAYVWNDEQTEAWLEVAGDNTDVTWTDFNGNLKKINYSVPTVTQCKSCHSKNNELMPIGPSARQLNKTITSGKAENQLIQWEKTGILSGLPEIQKVQKLAQWDDPKGGKIAERARALLDINCGHCHNENGPAKTSGLNLDIFENDLHKLGIRKPPIAAGRGSGGLKYAIVPGKPEESILYFRMKSNDPGIMMPEIGRKMVHEEGLELIKEWIKLMKN
ncbi:SO2930 family diheme c-type cytochrome [Xanthovirga aplysinae]|uniref:SO2930 family diheme c-type cytochrome n=1 Tax=Xanthovirga aplysinae TaxID=2529853 RepID=UPI0012BBFAFE|nr:SO2930 family diheme c-type cytochrome [Xanthovirga aplysinae]MTI31238.1 hypothetical protein [Xanthovirga aplysinae]